MEEFFEKTSIHHGVSFILTVFQFVYFVQVIDNMESQGREAKKRFASKPFGFKTWNMRNWLRRIGPLAMWGAIVELPGIHNYLLRSLKIGIRRNVVIFHKKLEVLKGS